MGKDLPKTIDLLKNWSNEMNNQQTPLGIYRNKKRIFTPSKWQVAVMNEREYEDETGRVKRGVGLPRE